MTYKTFAEIGTPGKDICGDELLEEVCTLESHGDEQPIHRSPNGLRWTDPYVYWREEL